MAFDFAANSLGVFKSLGGSADSTVKTLSAFLPKYRDAAIIDESDHGVAGNAPAGWNWGDVVDILAPDKNQGEKDAAQKARDLLAGQSDGKFLGVDIEELFWRLGFFVLSVVCLSFGLVFLNGETVQSVAKQTFEADVRAGAHERAAYNFKKRLDKKAAKRANKKDADNSRAAREFLSKASKRD